MYFCIIIDCGEMNIKITYRRTRRLSMRVVSNGDLHVSAPRFTPKRAIDQFIRDNEAWIQGAMQRQLEANRKRLSFYEQLPLETKEQARAAADRLDAMIKPMLLKYTELMGVHPQKITYKPTISRWGACNKKTGVISFSTYLLLLPEWCVEHVVVHELAHLVEPNHGPKFHALMDRYYPRWKEARKATRALIHNS